MSIGTAKLENKMCYWDNICRLQAKQTAKGISTYGQTLEENTLLDDIDFITMAQEEVIDFLMYSEGLKQKLIELHERLAKLEDDCK